MAGLGLKGSLQLQAAAELPGTRIPGFHSGEAPGSLRASFAGSETRGGLSDPLAAVFTQDRVIARLITCHAEPECSVGQEASRFRGRTRLQGRRHSLSHRSSR